jgi:hypothetical protein
MPVWHLPGEAGWACTCCVRDWQHSCARLALVGVAVFGGDSKVPLVATTTDSGVARFGSLTG